MNNLKCYIKNMYRKITFDDNNGKWIDNGHFFYKTWKPGIWMWDATYESICGDYIGQYNNSYPCPIIYPGIFQDNTYDKRIWNGDGIIMYKNGNKYNGGIKLGKRCGKGSMIYLNGNDNLCSWDDNGKNGIYYGEWHNDKKHGYGTFINNGEKYIGYWDNDKKHGEGILENIRWGAKIIGEWKDNKPFNCKSIETRYYIKGKCIVNNNDKELIKLRKSSQRNLLSMILNKKIKLGTNDDINQMLIDIGY